MKKTWSSIILSVFVVLSTFSQSPKYIFYMIGDGMGLNQVNLAEIFLAHQEDRNTVFPLVFSTFPFATFATSYSSSHNITDSAAGGTALAVGHKTKNGVLGMDSLTTTALPSIAYAAKNGGMKVGIITSVSIDHATPAAFYAHRPSRSMYYEIAQDLIKSDFDFFGGSGFKKPDEDAEGNKVPSIFPQFEQAGYKLIYGKQDYNKLQNKKGKIIYMNEKGTDVESLPFAIDQKPTDLNLSDITSAAVESLHKDNPNGFFLMVEGGKIDWACHSNDGATVVQEMLDFNASVEVAYEFYKKYPNETLIVVTADHETGGMSLGYKGGGLKPKMMNNQKLSKASLSQKIRDFRKTNGKASWDQVKVALGKSLGLFSAIEVNPEEEEELRAAYTKSFVNHQNETEKSLYANDDMIAAIAVRIVNRATNLAWGTGGHTASYIPIYSIGKGAENFSHKMENIDIPRKIAKVFELEM